MVQAEGSELLRRMIQGYFDQRGTEELNPRARGGKRSILSLAYPNLPELNPRARGEKRMGS